MNGNTDFIAPGAPCLLATSQRHHPWNPVRSCTSFAALLPRYRANYHQMPLRGKWGRHEVIGLSMYMYGYHQNFYNMPLCRWSSWLGVVALVSMQFYMLVPIYMKCGVDLSTYVTRRSKWTYIANLWVPVAQLMLEYTFSHVLPLFLHVGSLKVLTLWEKVWDWSSCTDKVVI
jgi:hypothetical protein